MKRAHYIRVLSALLLSAAAGAGALTAAAEATGCSAPDTGARVDPIGPDRAQFDSVAPMLVRRCGSIDCHGSPYRNMRIYGYGGQRIGAPGKTTPESPMVTTVDEAEATYQSVIGLEPEIMRAVVQAKGAGVERLTFIRKGRGAEDHKGDKRLTPDADLCATSWLASNVDVAACKRAACITTTVDGGVSKDMSVNCL